MHLLLRRRRQKCHTVTPERADPDVIADLHRAGSGTQDPRAAALDHGCQLQCLRVHPVDSERHLRALHILRFEALDHLLYGRGLAAHENAVVVGAPSQIVGQEPSFDLLLPVNPGA